MKAPYRCHGQASLILRSLDRTLERSPRLRPSQQSDRRAALAQFARALLRRSDSSPSVPDRERVQVVLKATRTKPLLLSALRRVLPQLRGLCVPGLPARVGLTASAIRASRARFRGIRSVAKDDLFHAPNPARDRCCVWL